MKMASAWSRGGRRMGILPLVRIVDCVTPCGLSIPTMPRPSSRPRLGLDVGLRRKLDQIAAARLRRRRFQRGLALQQQCIEAGVDRRRRFASSSMGSVRPTRTSLKTSRRHRILGRAR